MYSKYTITFLLSLYGGFLGSAQVYVNKDGNIETTIYHPAYRQRKNMVSSTPLSPKNIVPFVPEEFIIYPKKEQKSLTGQEYTAYWRLNSFLSCFKQTRAFFDHERTMKKKQLTAIYLNSKGETLQRPRAKDMILHALQHDDVVDAALAFSFLVASDQHLLKPVCEKAD